MIPLKIKEEIKMKKRLAFVLTVTVIMALAGCSSKPNESSAASVSAVQSTSQEASTSSGGKTYTIALSNAELVNAWRVTFQKDFEETTERYGFNLISRDANQDTSKQLKDVEEMLAQKPDIMIVSPLEAEATAPVVELCEEAQIPLIVIDRFINREPGNGMFKAMIAQDHTESGVLLAQKAVELLTDKYGEPKGNVVRIQGTTGASGVIQATEGWDSVMKDYPNIKVIYTGEGMYSKEGGMKAMEDALQAFPEGQIDIVKYDYSDMGMGALQAIQDAGRDELLGYIMGEGGHIKALEMVANGTFAMEVQIPPYFAEVSYAAAKAILEGEPYEVLSGIPVLVFSSDKPDEAVAYIEKIKAAGLEF